MIVQSFSQDCWDLVQFANGLWKASYQPAFWDFPVKEGSGLTPETAKLNAKYTVEYIERCDFLRELRAKHVQISQSR